jgi:multidrug efflux pump subunit AcrB
MAAFLALDAFDQTINMISLFAFIMTLGILVDDAIIVGENIFRHYNRGKSPSTAVVDGLKEVGGPVVMAVSTTVVDVYKRHHREIYCGYAHGRHHHINRIFG